MRRIAALAGLLLLPPLLPLPGCRSSDASAPAADPTDGPSPDRALLAPSLADVDPAFRRDLERVEGLMQDGGFAEARRVLDGVLARRPRGRTLEVARAFDRMLDLDPSFVPALTALAQAVRSGSDREAAAILARLEVRRPRGRVQELVRAYRTILAGRGVVAGLHLRLECRPEPAPEPREGAPADARFARLVLVAQSTLGEAIEVATGPATLTVTRSVVGANGLERDDVETRTYGDLRPMRLEPGGSDELSLARFFLAPGEEDLATRMRFGLGLRSGSARILPGRGAGGGREVPLMRLHVAEAEATALAPALRGLAAATPEELASLASGAATIDLASALAVAVRLPPGERERALDLLEPIVDRSPGTAMTALVPALRWIALTSAPGGDPLAWRAWLSARAARKAAERPRLLLPRVAPEEPGP